MADLDHWQFRLRGLTGGAGTDYELERDGITGLGTLEPTTADRDQHPSDGASAGTDTYPTRRIMIPVTITGTDPADAMGNLRLVKTAFARATDLGLVELEICLPGLTDDIVETLSFFGRPRGARDDLTDLKSGELRALCRFDATDPLGYGLELEVTGFDEFTLDIEGDFPTSRAVFTIVGDGNTPVLTNHDDEDRFIAWINPLANAAVRIVDLKARTVVDEDGAGHYDEIAAGSPWFVLWPGENDLELEGAGTVDVTVRPAYN